MYVTLECLCLKLRMVSRATASLYDHALQPADLTHAQFSTLRNIYRFEPAGLSKLADIMLTERTTLTRNLEVLRERGFVDSGGADGDVRVRRPILTKAGEAKLRSAIPRWRLAQRRVLGGLGNHGWLELRETLKSAAAVGEEGPERCAQPLEDFGDSASLTDAELTSFDPVKIRRCVNSSLQGAARIVTRQYDAALRPHDLKITQFHVMAGILENPGSRITDLAALLLLDQASTTLAVAALRKKGWITDAKALALSELGHARLEECRSAWAERQSSKMRGGGSDGSHRWLPALERTLSAALKAQLN
jgi:DNA-binding MarR family transcriptional regulator